MKNIFKFNVAQERLDISETPQLNGVPVRWTISLVKRCFGEIPIRGNVGVM